MPQGRHSPGVRSGALSPRRAPVQTKQGELGDGKIWLWTRATPRIAARRTSCGAPRTPLARVKIPAAPETVPTAESVTSTHRTVRALDGHAKLEMRMNVYAHANMGNPRAEAETVLSERPERGGSGQRCRGKTESGLRGPDGGPGAGRIRSERPFQHPARAGCNVHG